MDSGDFLGSLGSENWKRGTGEYLGHSANVMTRIWTPVLSTNGPSEPALGPDPSCLYLLSSEKEIGVGSPVHGLV